MALTINTNLGSLIVQKDLDTATRALNKALEKANIEHKANTKPIETENKIEEYKMNPQLSSISVVQDNVAIGSSMLSTVESNLDLISEKLQQIKDLVNNTDKETEVSEKAGMFWDEINKIVSKSEFDGTNLLNGSAETTELTIGIDSTEKSKLSLNADLFTDASPESLFKTTKSKFLELFSNSDFETVSELADNALATINERKTNIDGIQNKLDNAADFLEVRYANITSSLSTMKDADVAAASSDEIKSQILEQASASLSSAANQIPSIAINLL